MTEALSFFTIKPVHVILRSLQVSLELKVGIFVRNACEVKNPPLKEDQKALSKQ